MKVDKQQPDIDATLAQMAKERDARVLLDELTEHLTKQKTHFINFGIMKKPIMPLKLRLFARKNT